MQLNDFDYQLPPELIAHQPLPERTASRLLIVENAQGQCRDAQFSDILELIDSKDLLVFNNTRAIPASLYGHKASGGKIEVLVERIENSHQLLVHLRASKAPKPGTELLLEDTIHADVLEREGDLFRLRLKTATDALSVLDQYGHMPLPPYIDRADQATDRERYQTVYAQEPGAVAAPTAGLHFDNDLLQALRDKGVATTEVTLHVGAGTFQPVRVQDISQHVMHAEQATVSTATCEAIAACRARGGRVIAVGTTSVRSLESAAQYNAGTLNTFQGETKLFITPGYDFKVVDALITNFHLPQSTLLMLVSAFSGVSAVKTAYQHAIQARYRFFSYGDAMFLTRQSE